MSTCRGVVASLLAVSTARMLERPARADFPAVAPYLGIEGGANWPLREWDLGDKMNPSADDREAILGLRLGLQLFSRGAVEIEFAGLPEVSRAAGDTGSVAAYDLQLLYHFIDGDWSPVVQAGAGVYHSVSASAGKEKDPRGHLGLGVRRLLGGTVALRLDVRDAFTDGNDQMGAHNVELLAGIDLFEWGTHWPPADRDGDGISDDHDACPDITGMASARGCFDGDGDGIAQDKDACADDVGPASTMGCPDTDADRIADRDDACPKVAGPAQTQGCPDGDGDGIADRDDACPEVAGLARTRGCPDGDGDGIADPDDRCPQQPGPAKLAGCPDRDGDGIADVEDRCPDVPGIVEQQGCLPAAVENRFTGAIRGIWFMSDSARIDRDSFALLNEAVKVLQEFPGVRLRIEGHADESGNPEGNIRLSQARANSVRGYLISKGVDAGRLEAVGYGDTRPVAKNTTSKGRAANRRIEFTSIGAEEK